MFFLDSRSLGLMRISISLCLLADLVLRAGMLQEFYGENGFFSLSAMKSIAWEKYYFTLFNWFNGSWFPRVHFALAILSAFMLLVGFKVKWNTVLSWVLLISLHNRNQLLLNGGDALLSMILFWGMFLPWGEKFSLDNKLNAENNSIPYWAAIGLTGQIFFEYFFSGFNKSTDLWFSGKAFEHIMVLDQLTSDLAVLVTSDFVKSVVFPCIFFGQMLVPFCLIIPSNKDILKSIGLGMLFLFHVFIFLFFDLGIFPFVCIAGLIGLVPSGWFLKSPEPAFHKTSIFNWKNMAAMFFFLYILILNLEGTGLIKSQMVTQVPRILFRLDQPWKLFNDASIRNPSQIILQGEGLKGLEIIPDMEFDFNIRWVYFRMHMGWIRQEKVRTDFLLKLSQRQKQPLKSISLERVDFKVCFGVSTYQLCPEKVMVRILKVK